MLNFQDIFIHHFIFQTKNKTCQYDNLENSNRGGRYSPELGDLHVTDPGPIPGTTHGP